jgi:hypothetical protein
MDRGRRKGDVTTGLAEHHLTRGSVGQAVLCDSSCRPYAAMGIRVPVNCSLGYT